MNLNSLRLLSVAEMARADQRTIAAGTPQHVLMERAGRTCAQLILSRRGRGRALILAGPGNNGGDGHVVAQLLTEAGWHVDVASLDTPDVAMEGYHVLVDALFGIGLTRALTGAARHLVEAANRAQGWKIAVDLPSGVAGDSGAIMGVAFMADDTVTFAAKKPGHLLYPGRGICGQVHVADIGIAWESEGAAIYENGPALFASPSHKPDAHKYMKGHALVMGGERYQSGAARLCAEAALRGGAGLVSIFARLEDCDVYAAHLTSVMLKLCEDAHELVALLEDKRVAALALGPGAGVNKHTMDMVLGALSAGRPLILDADALTAFEDEPSLLWQAIQSPVVLTPHEGEFRRLFPDLDQVSKVERARLAAERAGAVMVLKGADTVIAAPDGTAIINGNAPVYLATAGSGDVLAGLILSGLAQEMPAFDAAARGVYLHGALGTELGPGCIAEDMPKAILRLNSRL